MLLAGPRVDFDAQADVGDLHLILHTSLSGVFNNSMVRKVGADQFVPKFHPDGLARAVSLRVFGTEPGEAAVA